MDTSPDIAARLAQFHAELTPDERWRIAAQMFETARAIVASSLPVGLSPAEQAVAIARRLYDTELPEAAFEAIRVAHSQSQS